MINNRWSKVSKSKGIYLPSMENYQFIDNKTKLCLMGSCFADEIGWCLHSNGLNIGQVEIVEELKQALNPWGSFFNTSNLLEILSHSLGQGLINFNENHFVRIPKNMIGNHYESAVSLKADNDHKLMNLFFKARLNTNNLNEAIDETNRKLNLFTNSLIEADVYIITLGLIETWIDDALNLTWHAFHGKALNKKSIDDRASFKRLTFQDNEQNIKKIIQLLLGANKNKKIIFTISPIPLSFTFTDQDIVVANRYNKSVLRNSIENFIDNKRIFYFPSFEIVTDCVGWPKAYSDEDKRHVKISVFNDYIAPLFLKKFTNL